MTPSGLGRDTEQAGDITACLLALKAGGRAEVDALFSAVYDRLHRLARARLRGARGHTLDATALVHEVFLRFVDAPRTDFHDRQHFFATAARAMRQIVVSHARRRIAAKRGGGVTVVSLYDEAAPATVSLEDVLTVDRALSQLAAASPRLVTIVELCFFSGMTTDEAGEALGLSARTVKREWQKARILLMALLQSPQRGP
ncbi:MAG: sigma-70 family RNA polymerase sigma factor [Acidobacteria bacterium]|nr:sigma-70 family RNA polymerase sigma factor [Acidobacteriota bacterium]